MAQSKVCDMMGGGSYAVYSGGFSTPNGEHL